MQGNKRNPSWLKKFFPALAIPFIVGVCELNVGIDGTPYIAVGSGLGIAISVLVPAGWPALFTSLAVSLMILSASYIHVLQEHAISEEHSQEPIHKLMPKRGLRHGGMGRKLPHGDPSQVHDLESMSVVLPCAFEGGFAEKTVDAVIANTKPSRLHEIVVVDDGSQPPLQNSWPKRFTEMTSPRIRIVRHQRTEGLISAKKTGGDAATGDVIVFFDCHVSPRPGWEEAFIKQMKRAGDHKTVVVPTITSLDPDTWQEIRGGPSSKACFVLLNADFTWLAGSGRDVPLMSGGLLGISRKWWQETGGYDEHMVAWGGENIDQSLRIWLCGGRIEVAEGAYVAHMWRDPKKPKTMLRYPIPTRDVMRNKARAVTAWFDGFRDKVFTFPEYEAFTDGSQVVGDMSNFDKLKSRMTCAPFSSYINRFSYVYIDGGLIPSEVYQIREESTQLCLERSPQAKQPHNTILAPCAGADEGGNPGSISELQLWHGANRDRSEAGLQAGAPCCSGIMNWNFNTCLDAQGVGARVRTYDCQLNGHSINQAFALTAEGDFLYRNGEDRKGRPKGGCLAPEAPTSGHAVFSDRIDQVSAFVEADTSRNSLGHAEQNTHFKDAFGNEVPRRFRLRSTKANAHGSCAVATGDAQSGGAGWTMNFAKCDASSPFELFYFRPLHGGFQVIARDPDSKTCLDAGSGHSILLYPCYEDKVMNRNQIWHLRKGHLTWGDDNNHVAVDFQVKPDQMQGATSKLRLETCTDKKGQRLRKHDLKEDGTFLIQDEDTKLCLAPPKFTEAHHLLDMIDCTDGDHRWKEDPRTHTFHFLRKDEHNHELCLDASDYTHPVLTRCNGGKTQRWKADEHGWLKIRHHVEDNGRRRYFERCIDSAPEEHVTVAVQPCDVARARKISWTRINSRTPPETIAWNQAPKPSPDDPVLGGDAEPPP